MSCSQFDLRDYFLGELPAQQRRVVETHLSGCAACREELEALGFTRSALLTVREEEPPRRIAFVSDKVFEPSWWQRLSGSRLGFASAALLSGAIVFHGVQARQVVVNAPAPVAVAQEKLDQQKIEAEVSKRVQASLEKVVLDSERRQAARIEQVSAQQKQMEFNHKADLISLAENFDVMRKRLGIYMRASNDGGASQ
jgi:anti-sigma factor RsiW